ncbi:MAG: hypothetical protein EOP10_16900 [Proteobacteria bacterium]|nr:MAG: hypothetical protein EOP10_16900 [Pseudomonadota bacterium]
MGYSRTRRTEAKGMNVRFILFALSCLIFFVTERSGLSSTTSFTICVALWVTSLLFEYRELKYASPPHRFYFRSVLSYRSVILFGVILYLLSQTFAEASAKIYMSLAVLSLASLGIGTIWGVSLESLPYRGYSYKSPSEIMSKTRSSLSLAFLLITLASINYIAARKDFKIDASFLKASQAGEASRKTVARLEKPIRVGVFFNRESEVLPFIRDYFDGFDKTKLKLEYYDKDFNPTQAEEFRVARNGQIVVLQDEKRQRFEIGDKIEEARRNLRTLDASFLKALLQLTSVPATIYFTSTHGEMLWETGSPVRSMALFEELLRGLNFKSRRLTSLFQDVPAETKIVAIVGPLNGFTEEEIATLSRYLQKGGRLFVALDIDQASEVGVNRSLDELPKFLESLGIRYSTDAVANDQRFVAAARDKSDRTFIFSNVFANHPTVATAGLSPERMTFMSHRTGSFDLAGNSRWLLTPVVKSLAESFRDSNGNFEADANEKRGSYPLIIAAESPEKGRVVVYSDATALSNTLMKVAANQLVALDSMRWLADRTEEAGAVASEEDVLIRQEKSRETLVFYGSIFAMPLLVLFVGAWATRRRSKSAEKGI